MTQLHRLNTPRTVRLQTFAGAGTSYSFRRQRRCRPTLVILRATQHGGRPCFPPYSSPTQDGQRRIFSVGVRLGHVHAGVIAAAVYGRCTPPAVTPPSG